jgi:hypothetical protein
MPRNLYILAAALGLFAALSMVLSFTGVAHTLGSPGDASLWRTTGYVLLLLALLAGLGAVLSALFEQAERRADQQRLQEREARRRHL